MDSLITSVLVRLSYCCSHRGGCHLQVNGLLLEVCYCNLSGDIESNALLLLLRFLDPYKRFCTTVLHEMPKCVFFHFNCCLFEFYSIVCKNS